MLTAALSALALSSAPFDIEATLFPAIPEEGITNGCLTIRSGATLEGNGGKLGGLSAFRLVGDTVWMVSDDAHLYRGRAIRDAKGFTIAVADVERWRLAGPDGKLLAKSSGDAEGLAYTDDRVFVSFEGQHRIAPIDALDDGWREGDGWSFGQVGTVGSNEGFEALAARPGTSMLVAIAEGTTNDDIAPVLFIDAGDPDASPAPARYRTRPPYKVTDAAFDPETGDLVVLERAIGGLRGPRMRLSRVPAAEVAPNATLEGETLGEFGIMAGIDNMEGLDLTRQADGTLAAHVVSDDNFSMIQRTVLIGLEIAPRCLPAAEPAAGNDPAPEQEIADGEGAGHDEIDDEGDPQP